MTVVDIVDFVLSVLVVFGGLLILILLFSYVTRKFYKNSEVPSFGIKVEKFLKNNSLLLAFIVALTATGGSLFYSEIAGYTPCKLCWLQRIFMYPLALMFGLGFWKNRKSVWLYAMPMAVIGSLIAVFHYYVQVSGLDVGCSAVGYSASCSTYFVLTFGYITIPMMALTAFLLIIALGIIRRR